MNLNELLNILVYDKQQLVYQEELAGPVEIGRQGKEDTGPFRKRQLPSGWRMVVAKMEEDIISRKHVLVESLTPDRIKVTNLSEIRDIGLRDGTQVKPKNSCELGLPAVLTLGEKAVRIQKAEADESSLKGLRDVTRAPGNMLASSTPLASLASPRAGGMEIEELMDWLQAVMGVIQSAAGSSDFFQQAAQALVTMIGLDSGRVLTTTDQHHWDTGAIATAPQSGNEPNWEPSQKILKKVSEEKRTFWQAPEVLRSASLLGVKAVVAAPILNRQGEVIGVLYGDRRQNTRSASLPQITKLEAMLVQLLACGVAAGLARLEKEQALLRARVQFEQFFTPELSTELEMRPDLLKGQDLEISVLFCDIRGFSRISERLGPAKTVEWIVDVMGELSECVIAQNGVLVDYIGDELIAMWGAPKRQPDHARLACRAAVNMLEALPRLNTRWEGILQEQLSVGIGINTGMARVGNIGTQRKFKYGALGNTINLASRVQGATKYLKSKLLVTGATQKQLDAGFQARRLCTVRVVNIAEPVDLYEMAGAGQANWSLLQQEYHKALEAFEKREFRKAAGILGTLIKDYPDDGPSLVLMSLVINALREGPFPGHPVWELAGK